MAGIKDIAKYCNVSISTVSNILNGKPGPSEATKKMVLLAAEQLNYRPNFMAKNLKQRTTRTLGVITEDLTTFTTPDIVDGINAFCEENKYQMILGNLRLYKKYQKKYYVSKDYYGQVEDAFLDMQAKQVEGIIYVAGYERKLECIPENLTLPVVTVYGYSEKKEIPSIMLDDEQGGYEAALKLIEKGHTRIGVVAGPFQEYPMRHRLKGYQKALFENHIFYDPSLLVEGDWERYSGYHAMKQLLEKEITAVFSMNDMMVVGINAYLEEKNLKMGEDISVIGYDNREFCSWFPAELSTMELPLQKMGYQAAQVTVHMLRKDPWEELYKVKCRYIERGSISRKK